MDWPQLIFSIALIVIGGTLIAYYGLVFLQSVIFNEAASSVAPVFGGVIAAVGVAPLPFRDSWHGAWVPLLIDWGGIRMFLWHWYSQRSMRRRRRPIWRQP